jgi:hypothetical protein
VWLFGASLAYAAPWGSSCIQPITVGQTVSGQLTTADCNWYYSSTPQHRYYTDVYSFNGTAGQQISIALSSAAINMYVELYSVNDVAGSPLVGDDNGGGGDNARIPPGSGYYTLPANGTYFIWAQTADPDWTGPYSLVLGGIPSAYARSYVQKAYVAYYGRPADPSGLTYWAGRMDGEGGSLNAIIAAFGYSDEFNRRYGGLTNTQLVTKIYQQALGRNPDAGGLNWYVAELLAGRRTLQTITLDVLNGATTAPDSTVVANKLEVAAYYTAKVEAGCGYGSEQDGVNALSGVTANPATAASAKAAIDARCGGGSQTALTLMTNPTDAELLKAVGADGTQVQYFGGRDAVGKPTGISSVVVAAPNKEVTIIAFDAQSRPVRMVADNGTIFQLAYLDNGEAVVTAIAPDGSTQVNTKFKLNQGALATGFLLSPKAMAAQAGTSSINVRVLRCGAGVTDASVVVYMSNPGDILLSWQGPAEPAGGGRYTASLPTNLNPPLNGETLRAAAEGLAGYLGSLCDVLSASGHPEFYLTSMCPAIGAALTTVTGPGGVAIASACTAVGGAVIAYCKVLGEGGVPGQASLAERILNALQDPRVLSGTATFYADAWVPKLLGGNVSPKVDGPASGPFPDLTIDVPDQGRIGSVTLSPASPGAGQDYTISVEVLCPVDGDEIRIAVVGSDGFTKSQTFLPTGGTQVFTMAVPGGEKGVRDTVTVTMRSSAGTLKEDYYLVFGD